MKAALFGLLSFLVSASAQATFTHGAVAKDDPNFVNKDAGSVDNDLKNDFLLFVVRLCQISQQTTQREFRDLLSLSTKHEAQLEFIINGYSRDDAPTYTLESLRITLSYFNQITAALKDLPSTNVSPEAVDKLLSLGTTADQSIARWEMVDDVRDNQHEDSIDVSSGKKLKTEGSLPCDLIDISVRRRSGQTREVSIVCDEDPNYSGRYRCDGSVCRKADITFETFDDEILIDSPNHYAYFTKESPTFMQLADHFGRRFVSNGSKDFLIDESASKLYVYHGDFYGDSSDAKSRCNGIGGRLATEAEFSLIGATINTDFEGRSYWWTSTPSQMYVSTSNSFTQVTYQTGYSLLCADTRF